MKRLLLTSTALVLAQALAQPGQSLAAWMDSAEARGFRDRVVQLALIYGESSGIDLRGLKVVATLAGPLAQGCAAVEVVTLEGDRELRRQREQACRH